LLSNLFKENNKLGCKVAFNPIESKNKLNDKNHKYLEDINQFQRLVEKLIYFTITRPYISFFIGQIS
jgi:hypothetical protein